MTLSHLLSIHIRGVHSGGNWTDVNLRSTLADITPDEATTRIGECNTIVMLVFHIKYYIGETLNVLRGGTLEAHDLHSYALPPIETADDWDALRTAALHSGEEFAELVGQLPESVWGEHFVEAKQGTYYRNIAGIIEHTHYHLGQIVLLKKLLRQHLPPKA